MSYLTFKDVAFVDVLPSGKSFKVKYESTTYLIPNFAVHQDSEVWEDSDPEFVGKLKLQEKIAIEKGLADPPSRSLGGGLPLKRHKLPPAPELLTDERLAALTDRLRAAGNEPDDLDPLLDENTRLRAWVVAALKTRARRKRK